MYIHFFCSDLRVVFVHRCKNSFTPLEPLNAGNFHVGSTGPLALKFSLIAKDSVASEAGHLYRVGKGLGKGR